MVVTPPSTVNPPSPWALLATMWNMPRGTRRFRLFMSSTFTDFQAEREALRERVFPGLRELCASRDAVFEAVDLRWGVSRREAEARRTIEVCLDEVDRAVRVHSRPDFLLLLGDRVGSRVLPGSIEESIFNRLQGSLPQSAALTLARWYPRTDENSVPAKRPIAVPKRVELGEDELLLDALSAVASTLGLEPFEEARLVGSGTEQEVRRRLMLGPVDADRLVVVRRDLVDGGRAGAGKWRDLGADGRPDPQAAQRLQTLLADATAAVGNPGLRLSTDVTKGTVDDDYLEALCHQVGEHLTRTIVAELDEADQQSPEERENDLHTAFGELRSRQMVGRTTELDRVRAWLAKPGGSVLVVHGPSGIGKSSLIAAATQADWFPRGAIVRFAGVTGQASNSAGIVSAVLRATAPGTPIPPRPEDAADLLAELLRQRPAAGGLTVVIDALDQLDTGYERVLATDLPESVRVMVSTTDGSRLAWLRARLPAAEFLAVGPLPAVSGQEALSRWLLQADRRLQPTQSDAVVAAFGQSGTPLHLRLLWEQARTWPSFAPSPMLPTSATDALDGLLTDLAEAHGELLSRTALTLLAVSREGLTRLEFIDLLSADADVMAEAHRRHPDSPRTTALPPVLWSRLRYDLEPYLAERERRGGVTLDFFHRQVGEAVHRRWLGSPATRRAGHEALVNYFHRQETWLRSGDAAEPNSRRLIELPLHLAEIQDCGRLSAFFADPDTLRASVAARGPWDLVGDLARAAEACPRPDLSALHAAMESAAPVIARDPSELPAQLLARVTDEAMRQAMATYPWPTSWLEPLDASLADAPKWVLAGHLGTVRSLALSPDGKWCVTVGNSEPDRTVRVWDLRTGRQHRVLTDLVEGGSYTPICFNGYNRAVLGLGERVAQLDPETGQLDELRNFGSTVTCVAAPIVPETGARILAVAATQDRVLLIGPTGVDEIRSGFDVTSLACSPRGHRVAVLGTTDLLIVAETGEILARVALADPSRGLDHPWTAIPLAVDELGAEIRIGASSVTWDAPSGGYTSCPDGADEHDATVIALSPDGWHALSSTAEKGIAGWTFGAAPGPEIAQPTEVSAAAITPNASSAVVAHFDHLVRVWDLQAHQTAARAGTSRRGARAAGEDDRPAVVSDGPAPVPVEPAQVRSQQRRDEVEITDHPPGKVLRSLRGGKLGGRRWPWRFRRSVIADFEPATFWAVSREARRGVLFQISHGKRSEVPDPPDENQPPAAPMDVWTLDRRNRPRSRIHTAVNPDEVLGFAISDDGTYVIVSQWGSLRSYGLADASHQHRFIGHAGPAWSLQLISSLGLLVTGSEDATVRIWDATTASQVASFTGSSPIRSVEVHRLNGDLTIDVTEAGLVRHSLRLHDRAHQEDSTEDAPLLR